MTISLCMIARDEADQIGQCLRSVRGLVDEIVVVDTGSRDRTVEIAREYAARVVPFDWNDDFAAARNCSLEEASGDWVLVLDADERLFPRHFDAIRRLTSNPQAHALQVFVRTYTDDFNVMNWRPVDRARAESAGFCGYFDLPQVRLFRRDRAVRFEGIVHESVVPSLRRAGLPIHRVDIVIHHYKEGRGAEQRLRRNRLLFDLSRRRAELEKDDPDAWRRHGLAALDVGDLPAATRAFERAMRLAPDRIDLCFQAGGVLMLERRPEDAAALYRRMLGRFPDEPELLQSLGEALLAAGKLDEAREQFARSLELDPYLYRSLVGLGAVAMRENRFDAAADYFERARQIHSGLDVPCVNLGLIHLARGERKKALAEFRRAFAINPRRWQTLAGIAALLFDSGRIEEARQWYLRAVEAGQCAPEVYVKLSACCLALGLCDQARTWAEKASQADPRYASLPTMLDVRS